MTTMDSASSNAFFDSVFADCHVMGILRNFSPEQTVSLCERAWSLNISVVEVPIQDSSARASLAAATAAARRGGRLIGAGTVTSLEQVEFAASAGAAFTVAPGLDRRVLDASLEVGLAHLPGVATPTEIQSAAAYGLSWVKVFPALSLGADWIGALRGPFPELGIVATGGVSAQNASAFFDAGANVVAVGSALADREQFTLLAAQLQTKPTGG